MKKALHFKTILLCLLIISAVNSKAQQQFIHTASKENISCNNDCTILDVADLNGNPAAVIFVTPLLEKGINPNPHPICAYYFKGNWHIFNLDRKAIPIGSEFNVEYFIIRDILHFQYDFTRADIQADGSALIDHPQLNNNPTAKLKSFHSWNPDSQEAPLANPEEVTVQYNPGAGKWAISNTNKKPFFARVTYNIAITSPGRVNTLITPPRTSIQIPELIATPNINAVYGDIAFMWMSVWADGVKLPGDNKINTHLEETELYKLEMGVNNLITRKNTYDPITIQFHSGCQMFIPLLNAFINKQSMVFSIAALTNSASGKAALNYTLKLSGASIISYKQVFDPVEENKNTTSLSLRRNGYDEIKIKFINIEYINSAGATTTDTQ